MTHLNTFYTQLKQEIKDRGQDETNQKIYSEALNKTLSNRAIAAQFITAHFQDALDNGSFYSVDLNDGVGKVTRAILGKLAETQYNEVWFENFDREDIKIALLFNQLNRLNLSVQIVEKP